MRFFIRKVKKRRIKKKGVSMNTPEQDPKKAVTTTTSPSPNLIFGRFYPDDVKQLFKYGVLGASAMILYQFFHTMNRRSIDPCSELVDKPESMNTDPLLRDSFIILQSYRDLNRVRFRSAVLHVDKLLFLEKQLLDEKIQPLPDDKNTAFSYFKVGLNALNEFQYIVRDRLGNSHGMAANIQVQNIYTQMQKHLMNIFHLCLQFDPTKLAQRAKHDVETALYRFKHNLPLEDSYEKWRRPRKHRPRHRRPPPLKSSTGSSSGHSQMSKKSHQSKLAEFVRSVNADEKQ